MEELALIGVPSACSPVLVTVTPPFAASRIVVMLLIGIGAGVYFDLSMLSFQVPSELSAPRAAIAVIAKAMNALLRILPICQSPIPLTVADLAGCLKSSGAQRQPW